MPFITQNAKRLYQLRPNIPDSRVVPPTATRLSAMLLWTSNPNANFTP